MRTIVDLPDAEIRRLDGIAKRDKVSRAEVVRRAVKSYADQVTPHPIEAVFGIWKDRKDIGDGVEYQRRLRAEWDRK
ncbi:MAG: CopG family transcriptional regulator [Pseudomonadota bacterium]